MNVLDAIKKRRSVKHYDADHKLTEQELRTLLSGELQDKVQVKAEETQRRRSGGTPERGCG